MTFSRPIGIFTLFAFLLTSRPGTGTEISSRKSLRADIVIYGGTSGGVIAAVQAARLGKSAVIIEPGRHVGGMSSGGLSWTDIGSSPDRMRALGGLAREFYARIGAQYGMKPGTEFESPATEDATRTGVDFSKPPSLAFEPKVAEGVFREMLSEAGVKVYFDSRLQSVKVEQSRIEGITTQNDMHFEGRVFIDATYEGDLMAMAGVSYTVGREANTQYGETINGIQKPATNPRAGKFTVSIDPFRVAGDPKSGSLPYLLQPETLGKIGSADRRIQSYNYRVCLTDVPKNRRPIEPPDDYDPAHYELLARWTEVRLASGEELTLRSFLKYDPLQNGKYDFNNRWPISTDFIGGADDYPEANHEQRARIAKQHENYLRGFFHILATSDRVPANVRKEMQRFGLCKDEFIDNNGWPHQLYVREARRMVSDFVMTEHHCLGKRVAKDSIGLGTYGIDIHAVRRIVYNGQPVNEGSNGKGTPRPYPISYRSIVPRQSECSNLFVPFALSASHVAFGSIRMEPVFMTLSQSAATAGSIAIDAAVPVQEVPYAHLQKKLLKNGLALEWK